VPPIGVNENVMENEVGTNTAVLPSTCPGEKTPVPLIENSTVWEPQIAVKISDFLALVSLGGAPPVPGG
jgi:hypothetical protein